MSPKARANWVDLGNPTFRSWSFQLLATLLTMSFIGYIIYNTATNLARQGIASGFDFLDSTAGFDIILHLVEYTEQSSYGQAFVVAILNTLMVSALGIFFATIIGFLIGVARLSQNWLLKKMASVYIEIVRNIPLLLQLFFWYFAVLRGLPGPKNSLSIGDAIFLNIRGLYLPKPVLDPGFAIVMTTSAVAIFTVMLLSRHASRQKKMTGNRAPTKLINGLLLIIIPVLTFYFSGMPLSFDIPKLGGFNFNGGMVVIPELVALLLALSIYTAAFIAEIVRSGIESVSKGQTEASLSLGLTRGQTLRLVVIPQALRVIIPPLTSQFLNLTKNSSLAAAIAYPDLVLVFSGTVLMQTGQAVEVIALTMTVYLVISLLISLSMNWFNHSTRIVER